VDRLIELHPVEALLSLGSGHARSQPRHVSLAVVAHGDFGDAEARIKDVRLHDARHTAGTLLGELHVDMHVIQQILGHAQITTTRRYTDPTNPERASAATGDVCPIPP
jgi:integrase